MNLKEFGQAVAKIGLPILGAALGGPAGGLIAKSVADTIGSPDASPQTLLKALTEDASARQKAREFEMTHELDLRKVALEEKRIDMEDRNSARSREAMVKDNTPKVLAFIVVGSFIGMVGFTLAGVSKVDGALAGTLVGYLSAKAEQVIAYYFGSSKGSADKNAMLAERKA